MGGGSKSSTTQTNSPPTWAQPLFEQSAGEASKLYNQGAGVNTYLGSTVSPLSDTTMRGVNQLANAGQNWDTSGGRSLYQGLGAAIAPIATGQNNPHFATALSGELDKVQERVQSQYSGAGRYGSSANTNALASELGNVSSRALANQWNQNIQNQLSAAGLGTQIVGGIGQMDQRNFENRLAGAGSTLQAGQILDQNAQAQLADEVSRYYALDNEDWTRLGMLQSAAAGAAGPYGQQVATSRQSSSPGIGGILSGVGSAVGGLKSDLRLKENMVRVGEANGIPIVEFNYKGTKERWRGTVAQAIPLAYGGAVVMEDDGFFAVDYNKLPVNMESAK